MRAKRTILRVFLICRSRKMCKTAEKTSFRFAKFFEFSKKLNFVKIFVISALELLYYLEAADGDKQLSL